MKTKKSPHEAGNIKSFESDCNDSELQLPLFEMPARLPSWPVPGTMNDTALQLLLDGREIDSAGFAHATGSQRLAAYVGELRGMGWPISTRLAAAGTTAAGAVRNVGFYRLTARALAEAVVPREVSA